MTTVTEWATNYITTTDLTVKLGPSPCPNNWSAASPMRLEGPGRPLELVPVSRVKKARTKGALVHPERRGELVHRFFHHELQAAELMLWALLAFPETPKAFRLGLVGIFEDEIRHMQACLSHLRILGFEVGAFPVRDWFWERVARCKSPREFVATMGIGFEGANLDHTERFIAQFEAAGDVACADILRMVHEEEMVHVKFAMVWFQKFARATQDGPFEQFDEWKDALPYPLSPVLMKGPEMDDAGRTKSGFGPAFVERLRRWTLQDR